MISKMPNPLNPHAPVQHIEETDSTMLEARRFVQTYEAEAGSSAISGTVIQAAMQTAGRGRLPGRRWESQPGDSLMFTIIFTKEDLSRRMAGRPVAILPLLCGLGTAAAVEEYLGIDADDCDIRVKWPNDILAGGRKLCGILCEASGDYIYAGIGINMKQTAFSEGLRRPACSLQMLGRSANTETLLELALKHIGEALENPEWRHNVEKRLYKIGESVVMRSGLPEDSDSSLEPVYVAGRLTGLDKSGALLINTTDGTVPVISGELQV